MGVRWGLLSTAAINTAILAGARGSDRVEIVAVGSRDPGRADAYAREHGIERAHGSYEALLADDAVEAVYVPLPNAMHVEWARRALEAGKHVLVEKPFGRSAEEVAGVAALASSRGLIVAEGFMWRHHPQTARALQMIRDGAIGRLLLVRAAFSFGLERLRGADDTRFDPALEGGGLMDVGCYCVSAIRLMSGEEPERVHAERLVGPSGVDVVFAATMRMPSGVLGQFDCGFLSRHRDELEIVGDEGSLFLDDPWHCRAPVIELRTGGRPELVAIRPDDPYRRELEDVSDAIRGLGGMRGAGDDAVAQARSIEALHEAASTGAGVTISRAG